jgi:large subunit ribosomal protein L29
MKASEIREMNTDELERRLTDLKEELFNFRFQHASGQLENTSRIKQTKRSIARVKTIMRERLTGKRGTE